MRKYSNYAVEIVNLNGNRQIREADDSKNYNDTICLYHNIKEEYMNRDIAINFVGLTSEGEQGIIFTKKNTLIEDEKRNVRDLINTITEATKQLQEQYRVIADKMAYYDKKKSNIDHLFVEAVDIDSLTEEDKAEIFDEIREVNLMRRDYKILNSVRISTAQDLNYITQKSQNILKVYEKNIEINSGKLKDLINRSDNYSGVHLIKEISYRDEEERKTIVKMISKHYDKVVHLPERSVVACYNKCS